MGVPEFSSSLTDFNQAQLDAIEAATTAVLAAVQAIKDTDIAALNTKVGANNNSPGTTTLFARLSQIAGFTDTLETLVGLNTASAGTATLFARLAQIAQLISQRPKYPRTAALYMPSAPVVGQWYTLVSVTGSGELHEFGGMNSGGTPSAFRMRVTIDGTAAIYEYHQALQAFYQNSRGVYLPSLNVFFESSCLVEWQLTTTSSGGITYAAATYAVV